jgi:hypothetical protein
MLHGHLDKVSHQLLQGWAADDAKPDEVVDVSVFVDGRKIAQVACDRLRADLQTTGHYGGGRHGFEHRFDAPLSGRKDIQVSVRFSGSGQSLAHGDCILNGQGVNYLQPAAPVAEDEPVLMSGPRSPRALFELLYWYDRQLGLGPLLSRLDLDCCTPQELYYATFGKLPEPWLMPRGNARYYAHDYLNELLLSDAFQGKLLQLLLHAYAEKRRLIFLHIPKCAGTDFSNKLKTRYPWLDFNIMDKIWTSKNAMLWHLSRLAVQLRFAETIYLCGHATPKYYSQHDLLRPMDRVVTIVRHPFEIMISQVNYVLTRFQTDAERGVVEPDTEEWLRLIGIERLPEHFSEEFILDAGMRVLRNSDTVKPNSMCYWLAGDHADAQSALDSLVAQNVEVTETDHYNEWLGRRWHIHSRTRDNSSRKFIAMDMVSQHDLDYMHSIAFDDMKLFKSVKQSIAQVGRPSVVGCELMSVPVEC